MPRTKHPQKCRICKETKPGHNFKFGSKICGKCESKGVIKNDYLRASENANKLHQEVRYKDARVVKGFKFEGKIAKQKDDVDYLGGRRFWYFAR